MKILATSDTHFAVNLDREDEYGRWFPDDPEIVFVHAGDLMTYGNQSEWDSNLDWLARLPYKTKLYVPGNHDFHLSLYPGPALQEMRKIGVTVVGLPGNDNYTSVTLPNGMKMLGLPYVLNLPRWANNIDEDELVLHLEEMKKRGPYDIIVSHSPAFGILDKIAPKVHLGIKSYRKFLTSMQPKIWIAGHFHNNYGKREIEGCKFYNVAMCDNDYNQVNRPVLINVED